MRSDTRYFLGFIIAIGLLILVIVLLFRGGGKPQEVANTDKPLTSYSNTDADVRMTIQGPIVADQDYRQVEIIVDRDNVNYAQIKGYNGDVIQRQQFANNEAAYSNFLYALARAGFTQGDKSEALSNEKGRCPLGRRYVFELRQGGETLQRFWATSCGGVKSYKGNMSLTITLFQAQVPDYSRLTGNVNLGS